MVESAMLTARTATVCAAEMEAGAVYKPNIDMAPTWGLMLQTTPWLVEPLTVAVNCCVLPAARLTLLGVTVSVTGLSVMVAVADWAGSAALVALSVTV